jgi:hypothetical protein
MKFRTTFFAMTTLALILGNFSAEAKMVCWKDKDGVHTCGNAVPPEYAQQSTKRLNKQGVTVEKTARAKTGKELKKEREMKREQAEKDKEERRIANAQARKDLVLLQTYNSEDELELARDGKIAVLDSRIKHNQQIITKLETSQAELQKDAAAIERSGKPVPDTLRKDLNEIEDRISKRQKVNEQHAKDQGEVRETFIADIARYRELKGLN